MLDLDHFKAINDTYGHLAGDAVLRESMHRVQSAVRQYDSVGRFGGEEFIVVLPGTDETDALTAAERIRLRINETAADVNGIGIPFTISQGLATSNGGTDVDGIIAMADQALYRAKENGRNRVEKAPDQK